MPVFFTGDELGSIKAIHCTQNGGSEEWDLEAHVLRPAPVSQAGVVPASSKANSIQHMALFNDSEKPLLAAVRSEGTVSAFLLDRQDEKLDQVLDISSRGFKPGHKFVGVDFSQSGLFSCTSNGSLGYSAFDGEGEKQTFSTCYRSANIPARLCSWRLCPSSKTFAYGGDEVDLSVWDVERTFQSQENTTSSHDSSSSAATPNKRRKATDKFPAELWRAKNLPNDSLDLRQPVHITSLTYLTSETNANVASAGVHLATGTRSGAVRRYDTRSARRPVANWTDVARDGGISVIQAGSNEYELFASDNGSHSCALDLRNGRVLYSYKKIQGAITSLAASEGSFLGSTSRDRYFRLHSTVVPPEIVGSAMDERGDVLGSLYMKSVPTAVVIDSFGYESRRSRSPARAAADEEGDEDVWEGMEDVDDSEVEGTRKKARKV